MSLINYKRPESKNINLEIAASAISELIQFPVKTYYDCIQNDLDLTPEQFIDIETVHKSTLIGHFGKTNLLTHSEILNNIENDPPNLSDEFQIFIAKPDGKLNCMFVTQTMTISELKQKVHDKFELPTSMLIQYSDKQLEDEMTLGYYQINHGDTINVSFRLLGGNCDFRVITDEFLNSNYHYDFTNTNDDGKTFTRGNKLYKRPCGWKRLALNVEKFEDNKWLGCAGNDPLEWPVSYHGTQHTNVNSIADEGFLLSKSKRFAFGKGIYSSPDINVAMPFAGRFIHDNVRYMVIFQNRVNPNDKTEIPLHNYWVTADDRNIRPYGLCYKRAEEKDDILWVQNNIYQVALEKIQKHLGNDSDPQLRETVTNLWVNDTFELMAPNLQVNGIDYNVALKGNDGLCQKVHETRAQIDEETLILIQRRKMLPDQIKTIIQEILKIQANSIDNVDFIEMEEEKIVIGDEDIEMGGVEESHNNTYKDIQDIQDDIQKIEQTRQTFNKSLSILADLKKSVSGNLSKLERAQTVRKKIIVRIRTFSTLSISEFRLNERENAENENHWADYPFPG
ncbi:10821_t:CDS:2 [Diversispora eburnea]|uniref:10821_t:CDS:1 n=1 Tax=Diversispora eburnea TaxID=1213867 RepID=A0A9N9BJ50_9GLOM|nr:10821_t:CDS:2 [Diversispora eburnea]